jgi:mannose-6-phosphate isomerase-like protein (cupin superfamily)
MTVARAGDEIYNPVTRERIIFRQTGRDTNGELLQFDDILEPGSYRVPDHLHPRQQERLEVRSGSMAVRIRGEERVLQPGESVVVPPGTPHSWWNPGMVPVHLLTDFRPALQTDGFFETLFGLARDGKLNERGIPNFWQISVLVPPFDMYLSRPPLPLQRLVLGLVAPTARLLGYRATYACYSRMAGKTGAATEVER